MAAFLGVIYIELKSWYFFSTLPINYYPLLMARLWAGWMKTTLALFNMKKKILETFNKNMFANIYIYAISVSLKTTVLNL